MACFLLNICAVVCIPRAILSFMSQSVCLRPLFFFFKSIHLKSSSRDSCYFSRSSLLGLHERNASFIVVSFYIICVLLNSSTLA